MKETVISANNISIGYPKMTNRNKTELYNSLSFQLYSGELTCLLGPNGAGKSTLLRTIGGMQHPLHGEIFLNERTLVNYSESELSRQIGLVLTDKTSVGGLTVKQLVALGRYPYTGFFGKLTNQDYAIVNKAMLDVGIDHKSDTYIAELSDGEKQKAMIAKALAQECPVLLLDEPTAFLDVTSRIDIMNLLHNLALKQKKTVLLSTHDIELALLLADRLWLLSRNRGFVCGITEDIVLNDKMNVFLDKEGIRFDKNIGGFYPVHSYERYVYVHASNPFYHWIKNFLNRNSWDITDDPSKSNFYIEVDSDKNIIVEKNNKNHLFTSFDQLLVWLNKEYTT